MTRMTDHALHAMLPDGEHIYYGYYEKPTVATGKALAFCTGGGIRYIPLTTLEKHEHLLCMNVGGTIMHPIEDSLTFTVNTTNGTIQLISDTYEKAYIGTTAHWGDDTVYSSDSDNLKWCVKNSNGSYQYFIESNISYELEWLSNSREPIPTFLFISYKAESGIVQKELNTNNGSITFQKYT